MGFHFLWSPVCADMKRVSLHPEFKLEGESGPIVHDTVLCGPDLVSIFSTN